MNIEQFLSMGGYAFYVWTAYALAMAMLAANLVLSLRRKAEVHRSIRRMMGQGRGGRS